MHRRFDGDRVADQLTARCVARQLPANGGRTATKAAGNRALAAAIRPHHHQRRPLLGRQMLVVGSHRNTLPERCCTWLLSPPDESYQLIAAYFTMMQAGRDLDRGCAVDDEPIDKLIGAFEAWVAT